MRARSRDRLDTVLASRLFAVVIAYLSACNIAFGLLVLVTAGRDGLLTASVLVGLGIVCGLVALGVTDGGSVHRARRRREPPSPRRSFATPPTPRGE